MDKNKKVVQEVAIKPVKYKVKDAGAHERQIWVEDVNNAARPWLRYDEEANRRNHIELMRREEERKKEREDLIAENKRMIEERKNQWLQRMID